MKRKIIALLAALGLVPASAFAQWTPLIQSTAFDGIKTDMLTATNGIILLLLIIVGLALLMKVFR